MGNISSIPQEMLENQTIKEILEKMKQVFRDTFDLVDDKIKDIPVPPGMEGVVMPMLKIQYANLIQTAFSEVYGEYISKASKDCTESLMYGGMK